MLDEFGGGRFQDLAQQARLESDKLPVDPGSGLAPVIQRDGVVAELDADFGEDAIGGSLDPGEIVLGQDVVRGDVAQDIGAAERRIAVRAHLAPGGAPATVTPAARGSSGIGQRSDHDVLPDKHRLGLLERLVTLENLHRLYKLVLCEACASSCLLRAI